MLSLTMACLCTCEKKVSVSEQLQLGVHVSWPFMATCKQTSQRQPRPMVYFIPHQCKLCGYNYNSCAEREFNNEALQYNCSCMED